MVNVKGNLLQVGEIFSFIYFARITMELWGSQKGERIRGTPHVFPAIHIIGFFSLHLSTFRTIGLGPTL